MSDVLGTTMVVIVNSNNLSVWVQNSEFNPTADSLDNTAYGATGHTFRPGLTNGTFTVDGKYDTTASTGPRAVLQALVGAAATTVVRRPEGTGSGLPQDSFSGLCTSYSESAPVADYVKWRAQFQISGAVTSTAQS